MGFAITTAVFSAILFGFELGMVSDATLVRDLVDIFLHIFQRSNLLPISAEFGVWTNCREYCCFHGIVYPPYCKRIVDVLCESSWMLRWRMWTGKECFLKSGSTINIRC